MKDAVQWVILCVVIILAGSGLYYTYQETRPCVHPIRYSIGAVDPRFEISTSTLVRNAQASATIWNTAAGKSVVV
jgi:hypothetical protein